MPRYQNLLYNEYVNDNYDKYVNDSYNEYVNDNYNEYVNDSYNEYVNDDCDISCHSVSAIATRCPLPKHSHHYKHIS